METLPLWPGAAYAVLLFAASRALRWRPLYLAAAGETALFFVFTVLRLERRRQPALHRRMIVTTLRAE